MTRIVDHAEWAAAGQDLATGQRAFVAIWPERLDDRLHVHLATRPPGQPDATVLTLATTDGHYPSIGQYHPGAILLERAAQDRATRDRYGLTADDLPDPRPWLDHDRPFAFRPALGEGVHQIPVGPIHAGIIEPGHFRFSVNGETIVRLEARLGYTTKGTLGLMRGAAPDHAARLAGRISGDSTIATSFAFALSCERALGIAAPPRAAALRGIMAELERLANHWGDFGAICNDAGFAILNAYGGLLRERVLRLAEQLFGHRLMMDRIVPGGVATDLDESGRTALRAAIPDWLRQFDRLVELYDKTASLQDRVVTTGHLDPSLARRLGAGGYVGRASGHDFDPRRDIAYPPYDRVSFKVPHLQAGDVDARVRIRIAEIRESAAIILALLDSLPGGPLGTDLPETDDARCGQATIEGFRGDIFAHLRIRAGRIEDIFIRDPSWFLWPALEAAIEGNILADFPLCNKSFNAAYSGCDL